MYDSHYQGVSSSGNGAEAEAGSREWLSGCLASADCLYQHGGVREVGVDLGDCVCGGGKGVFYVDVAQDLCR